MTCPICISDFNKRTCTEVKCPCDYSACKTCVRTYILNTVKEPHCMNCRVKWSPEFVKNAVGATFMNKEYREHKTKQLIDQVIARREEYVAEAIVFRDDREDKKAIYELTKEMKQYPRMSRQVTELEDAIEDIQNKIENRHGRPPYYRNPLRAIIYNRAHRTGPIIPKFIMPCPIGECNGMLNEDYCCQVCHKNTCSKCLEAKTVDHTCNPDSVASAKAINKESKPCPKCGCRISKIDGCDQMWCVVCRTAFSWNTGLIEDGHIHNPHYYQFLREQKAKEDAEAEVEEELRPVCGIRDNALQWMCRRLRLVESQLGNKGKEGAGHKGSQDLTALPLGVSRPTVGGNVVPLEERAPLNMMIEYIRYTNHISEVTVKQLERKQLNAEDNHKDIYLYILGEMDKPTLSAKLYLHQRAQEKNNMFLDIYKAIPMIVDYICQDIAQGQRDVITLHKTFQKYSAYFNVELLKLVKLYDTKQAIDIFEKTHQQIQYDIKSLLDKDLIKYNDMYNLYL